MSNVFKAGFIGFEDLVADLQTASMCIGLWLHPRYEHARPLVRASADVEAPLSAGVSLHVRLVDAVTGRLVLVGLEFPATFLLQGGSQAVRLNQLVESARVAGFHVGVANGDE